MVDVKEKKKQKKKNNTLDSELQIYIKSSEFGSLENFLVMDYSELYGRFCNEFWGYFQNSEQAQGRKSATFLLWVKRTRVARQAMSTFLSEHGAPKDNPYFWVMRFPEPQPTNYNGRSFPTGAQMVIAIYNGTGGVYTKADAELYNMTIKKEIEP